MTAAEAIAYFKRHYQSKNLVMIPADNPEEIICEIDPAQDHTDYSIALAAIKSPKPHLHYRTTETYEVLQGKLKLFVENKVIELDAGQKYSVNPHSIHHAEGNFTLVKVTSKPGWTSEDHILI